MSETIDYDKLGNTIAKALNASQIERRESSDPCGCGIPQPVHRRHHDLIDEAIGVLARLNNVKWGVFKALAILMVVGLFTIFFGVGLKTYILKWLGL